MNESVEYLSSQDAAERLGYTRQHIGRLARGGRLLGRKVGRDWIVSRESVERYAAQRHNLMLPLARTARKLSGRAEGGVR